MIIASDGDDAWETLRVAEFSFLSAIIGQSDLQ